MSDNVKKQERRKERHKRALRARFQMEFEVYVIPVMWDFWTKGKHGRSVL